MRIVLPGGLDGAAFWMFIIVLTMLISKGCWGVTLW